MPEINGNGSKPVDPVLYRPVGPVDRGAIKPVGSGAQGPSFDALLQRELTRSETLKFSAHAQKRLEEARITLDPQQVERLQTAVQKAADKGARESLVLMDNLALVVSIRNRTVITAVDGDRMKQNVFTNIDSAVIT